MASKRTLRSEVQKLGGTLADESSGRWNVLQCEAPAGKCWSATGDTHALRVEWRKDDPVMKEQALQDALERVSLGLTDCDCEECEK